jgi:hypothetical protein
LAGARSPGQWILDIVVYAPAGLAITVVEEMPLLADKGRTRLSSQLTVAKAVGRFAVQFGRDAGQRQLEGLVGRHRSAPVQAPDRADAMPTSAAGAGRSASVPRPYREEDDEPTVLEGGAALPGDVAPSEFAAGGAVQAIHGYDVLSASQVVKCLPGLSPAELEEVRRHEQANRHRRTIINRVDQLLASGRS